MIIQPNTLFRTFKSVFYWILVVSSFSLLFLVVLDVDNASTEDLDSRAHTAAIESYERRMGPFRLNDKEFTVLLNLKKYQGAAAGFDETAESLSIADKEGQVHYQKSFNVELGELGFAETVGICAYALESCDTKYFRNDLGRLIEDVRKGCVNKGLILYYGILPSAPSSGVSCQVFALKEERLTPLSAPLTVYGTIYELPHGTNENVLKLFDGNTMKFGVWTGWFEVIVPVKVLNGLRVVPLHHHLTYGYDAFEVRVERRRFEEETFVRLFEYPADSSIPRHVIIKKDTKVEFLLAYARVSIKSGDTENDISIDTPPWLKVRIDGREGFVRDAEDLLALGMSPAG
jgi:hypothetical protein